MCYDTVEAQVYKLNRALSFFQMNFISVCSYKALTLVFLGSVKWTCGCKQQSPLHS